MDTLVEWANNLWGLWLMAIFLGIAAWAFWPSNKARFEDDANIPFRKDDD